MTPSAELKRFLSRYSPDVRRAAAAALSTLRKRYPGAVQLVYDNYNALVIGFGPNERASDAWFSLALYPKYVRLFLLQGALIADPAGLLEGKGNQVRSIRLDSDASVLGRPAVRALLAEAVKLSDGRYDRTQRSRLIIRSISARQRPRR